ncbi:aminotransferase [Jeotgalicoccus coquinae]|uniref:cysteine-S-conjugate beta-lyase n=1 Tax=Jeotgalicoccus coquinae TaxID=709509 RepID=A0A6V7R8K2_9STAP|nr:aminotransferase class I/II-fold pyridoxal phosphate-dependent enzyme [Jeotgalicoccus coquinae]MBB6423193.1 cystathionine beta-lyase [Jeotgalicoccus coquinae]GGE09906.1 aminotransferase [Jeotgalicoccus coquinae]CAD2073344.1 Cystathionine beta-lyase PatB [Jeotgalicoccus coquinae]
MTQFDFNKTTSREGTYSVQYDGTEALFGAKGLEPFWIADMDIETPEAVRDAVKKRLDNGIFGYTMWQNERFYGPVKNWWETRFNISLNEEDIHYAASVLYTVGEVMRQVTDEGDGVILTTPSYNSFPNLIKGNDRTRVETPLIYDEDKREYFLNTEEFRELCSREDVTLYIHCNPHNPTGKIWSEEELLEIKNICKENDVYLISDEIHMDFVRPKEDFVSMVSLLEEGDPVLVTTGLGKSFNLASIPHSYYITKDRKITKDINNAMGSRYNVSTASSLALAAIEAAYTECGDWIDQLNDHVEGNFQLISDYIDEHLSEYLSFDIPKSTYLGWISFEKSGLNAAEVHKALVEVGGIAVSPGKLYLDDENNHFRINVASSRTRIEDGLERIRKTFEYLSK